MWHTVYDFCSDWAAAKLLGQLHIGPLTVQISPEKDLNTSKSSTWIFLARVTQAAQMEYDLYTIICQSLKCVLHGWYPTILTMHTYTWEIVLFAMSVFILHWGKSKNSIYYHLFYSHWDMFINFNIWKDFPAIYYL